MDKYSPLLRGYAILDHQNIFEEKIIQFLAVKYSKNSAKYEWEPNKYYWCGSKSSKVEFYFKYKPNAIKCLHWSL